MSYHLAWGWALGTIKHAFAIDFLLDEHIHVAWLSTCINARPPSCTLMNILFHDRRLWTGSLMCVPNWSFDHLGS